MATILLSVYSLPGPIHATRKVAKDLRAHGHTVHYIGFPDCGPHLEGESFFPVFGAMFRPSGAQKRGRRTIAARIRHARELTARVRDFAQDIADGRFHGFDALMATLQPDLIVIESTTFYVALWGLLARRFNIPAVLLNDCLTNVSNGGVPPVSSRLLPRDTVLSKLRIKMAWQWIAVSQAIRGRIGRWLYGWNVDTLVNRVAQGLSVPADALEEHEVCFRRVRAPEVVLMPATFEFPGVVGADRTYASASVDLDRNEPPFPWERLDPDKPIILCSLGTGRALSDRRCRRFYAQVIAAFAPLSRTHQLVVALYDRELPDLLGTAAAGVIVARRVPQIALLRRAALMITHGGSNSVRECLTLGVPMLLYPLDFDQFGHAARAGHHGIGLSRSVRYATVGGIRRDVTRLLTEPSYRERADWHRRACAAAEAAHSVASTIESFLPSEVAPAPRATAG